MWLFGIWVTGSAGNNLFGNGEPRDGCRRVLALIVLLRGGGGGGDDDTEVGGAKSVEVPRVIHSKRSGAEC